MILKVRMRNREYEKRHLYAKIVPEYFEYQGLVVKNPKWVDSDYFCMTTGDRRFKFRTLYKQDIICGWLIKA